MDPKLTGLAALDQRSREIFRQLVETYLDTGEPVGSRTISRGLSVNLSPASVRNVMADLEDTGLIASPHTSAGRIPTDLGLRFFVDAIMERGSLSRDERRDIDSHISMLDRQQRVEDVLADATNVLSGLSHCAGLVVTPKVNVRLRHIEFVNLSPGKALVVLVGEDGTVENRAIDVPAGLPASTLSRVSNFLNAHLRGKTIPEAQTFMASEIETLNRELDELSAQVVEQGLAVWAGDDREDSKTLIVRGRANLLENLTALDDLERLRKLFEDLEEKKELRRLLGLAEKGEGVRIFIGSENKLFSLSGSSVIVSPYHDQENNVVGVVGVIGPTRMHYARIVPMVDYTARLVGRLLS
jgi:heat-inducible transcriptional repressor